MNLSDFSNNRPFINHPMQQLNSPIPYLNGAQLAELNRKRILGRYARFMPIAQAVAAMSKDDSTKVGAIILGKDREIRSTGWNGAPRGSQADVDSRKERPEKYQWVSHAEMNAIAQAAKMGTSIDGCTMVVTHAPCMICARLIVQSGIKTVIADPPSDDFLSRWAEDFLRAQSLFKECGVDFLLTEASCKVDAKP